MSETKVYDIAIIGAGIVGLATALKLSENPELKIIILEVKIGIEKVNKEPKSIDFLVE